MSVFKYALILALLVLALIAVRILVLRISGVSDLRRRIRRFNRNTLWATFALIIGSACTLACFSQFSDAMTKALSSEFIADSRLLLKMLFGTESVFSAVQIFFTFSMLLFGFLSWSYCLYAVCRFVSCQLCEGRTTVRTLRVAECSYHFVPKRKLCYLFSRNLN